MFIRSQDGTKLIPAFEKNFEMFKIDYAEYKISASTDGSTYELGCYTTIGKAIRAIDMLQEELCKPVQTSGEGRVLARVFRMPKNNEVDA